MTTINYFNDLISHNRLTVKSVMSHNTIISINDLESESARVGSKQESKIRHGHNTIFMATVGLSNCSEEMKSSGAVILCVACAVLAPLCGAFAPSAGQTISFVPNFSGLPTSSFKYRAGLLLRMSDTEGDSEEQAKVTPTAPRTGTFYDDEVSLVPKCTGCTLRCS